MPPSPPPPAPLGDDRSSPSVSVVIPVLGEEGNLPYVLEALPPVDEVVVVDGGSSDRTLAVAGHIRPDAVLVRQTRSGRGNALACGFAASSGDIVVTFGADGSADPGDVPRFVRALLAGAEVAHGSRYRDGGADPAGHRLDRLAEALLTRLVNAVFSTRYTDLGWGYHAFRRDVLPALDLPALDLPTWAGSGRAVTGDGPEIETLIPIRTAAQGLRVVEVGTVRHPRMPAGRPEHRWHRAWLAVRMLIAEYLRHRRPVRRPPAPARHAAPPPNRRTLVEPPRTPPNRPLGARWNAPEPPEIPRCAPGATPAPGAHRTRDVTDYNTGVRRSGIYDTGAHRLDRDRDGGVHRAGEYDSGSRRSGLYDTGVHRLGVYDSGVHRTDVYDTGVHHLTGNDDGSRYRPAVPREVGGGRRRLDARDRRTDGRPDLTVIRGEAGAEPRRNGHLRALPGERSTR